MTDHSPLHRLVADLKHGLLEIEAHSSMLKKRIYELERHLGQPVGQRQISGSHVAAAKACDNRMEPFSFLDRML